jgi:2C-methyl-D-erythritol 2,4-cyclodiphosphate synthase
MSFKQISHQNIFESLKNQKNSVSIDARAFENLGFSGIFKAFSHHDRQTGWSTR